MIGVLIGTLLSLLFIIPGLWLLSQGHAVGVVVALLPAICAATHVLGRKHWQRRDGRAAATRAPVAHISANVRAELDLTPAWWDRQYDALVRKQIPRDWASHRDHELDEPITFYANGNDMPRYCLTCRVMIERPPDG